MNATIPSPTLRSKILDAEQRSGSWLALGNKWSEMGQQKKAESCYAKAQFWLDRMNKLEGNGSY